MIALIQRVSEARVVVDGEVVGAIDHGLLVLLGVEKGDDDKKAHRLHEKVLGYRIFGDDEGKMNLNVQQAGGQVLVVSQFTLAADTKKGCVLVLMEHRRRKLTDCTNCFRSIAVTAVFILRMACLLLT